MSIFIPISGSNIRSGEEQGSSQNITDTELLFYPDNLFPPHHPSITRIQAHNQPLTDSSSNTSALPSSHVSHVDSNTTNNPTDSQFKSISDIILSVKTGNQEERYSQQIHEIHKFFPYLTTKDIRSILSSQESQIQPLSHVLGALSRSNYAQFLQHKATDAASPTPSTQQNASILIQSGDGVSQEVNIAGIFKENNCYGIRLGTHTSRHIGNRTDIQSHDDDHHDLSPSMPTITAQDTLLYMMNHYHCDEFHPLQQIRSQNVFLWLTLINYLHSQQNTRQGKNIRQPMVLLPPPIEEYCEFLPIIYRQPTLRHTSIVPQRYLASLYNLLATSSAEPLHPLLEFLATGRELPLQQSWMSPVTTVSLMDTGSGSDAVKYEYTPDKLRNLLISIKKSHPGIEFYPKGVIGVNGHLPLQWICDSQEYFTHIKQHQQSVEHINTSIPELMLEHTLCSSLIDVIGRSCPHSTSSSPSPSSPKAPCGITPEILVMDNGHLTTHLRHLIRSSQQHHPHSQPYVDIVNEPDSRMWTTTGVTTPVILEHSPTYSDVSLTMERPSPLTTTSYSWNDIGFEYLFGAAYAAQQHQQTNSPQTCALYTPPTQPLFPSDAHISPYQQQYSERSIFDPSLYPLDSNLQQQLTKLRSRIEVMTNHSSIEQSFAIPRRVIAASEKELHTYTSSSRYIEQGQKQQQSENGGHPEQQQQQQHEISSTIVIPPHTSIICVPVHSVNIVPRPTPSSSSKGGKKGNHIADTDTPSQVTSHHNTELMMRISPQPICFLHFTTRTHLDGHLVDNHHTVIAFLQCKKTILSDLLDQELCAYTEQASNPPTVVTNRESVGGFTSQYVSHIWLPSTSGLHRITPIRRVETTIVLSSLSHYTYRGSHTSATTSNGDHVQQGPTGRNIGYQQTTYHLSSPTFVSILSPVQTYTQSSLFILDGVNSTETMVNTRLALKQITTQLIPGLPESDVLSTTENPSAGSNPSTTHPSTQDADTYEHPVDLRVQLLGCDENEIGTADSPTSMVSLLPMPTICAHHGLIMQKQFYTRLLQYNGITTLAMARQLFSKDVTTQHIVEFKDKTDDPETLDAVQQQQQASRSITATPPPCNCFQSLTSANTTSPEESASPSEPNSPYGVLSPRLISVLKETKESIVSSLRQVHATMALLQVESSLPDRIESIFDDIITSYDITKIQELTETMNQLSSLTLLSMLPPAGRQLSEELTRGSISNNAISVVLTSFIMTKAYITYIRYLDALSSCIGSQNHSTSRQLPVESQKLLTSLFTPLHVLTPTKQLAPLQPPLPSYDQVLSTRKMTYNTLESLLSSLSTVRMILPSLLLLPSQLYSLGMSSNQASTKPLYISHRNFSSAPVPHSFINPRKLPPPSFSLQPFYSHTLPTAPSPYFCVGIGNVPLEKLHMISQNLPIISTIRGGMTFGSAFDPLLPNKPQTIVPGQDSGPSTVYLQKYRDAMRCILTTIYNGCGYSVDEGSVLGFYSDNRCMIPLQWANSGVLSASSSSSSSSSLALSPSIHMKLRHSVDDKQDETSHQAAEQQLDPVQFTYHNTLTKSFATTPTQFISKGDFIEMGINNLGPKVSDAARSINSYYKANPCPVHGEQQHEYTSDSYTHECTCLSFRINTDIERCVALIDAAHDGSWISTALLAAYKTQHMGHMAVQSFELYRGDTLIACDIGHACYPNVYIATRGAIKSTAKASISEDDIHARPDAFTDVSIPNNCGFILSFVAAQFCATLGYLYYDFGGCASSRSMRYKYEITQPEYELAGLFRTAYSIQAYYATYQRFKKQATTAPQKFALQDHTTTMDEPSQQSRELSSRSIQSTSKFVRSLASSFLGASPTSGKQIGNVANLHEDKAIVLQRVSAEDLIYYRGK